jgi:hypothetical protein
VKIIGRSLPRLALASITSLATCHDVSVLSDRAQTRRALLTGGFDSGYEPWTSNRSYGDRIWTARYGRWTITRTSRRRGPLTSVVVSRTIMTYSHIWLMVIYAREGRQIRRLD